MGFTLEEDVTTSVIVLIASGLEMDLCV